MQIAGYRLLAHLGAGPDGAAYRATADDGPVEVRLLAGARSEQARWAVVAKRLRQASFLQHAAAVAVRELNLAHDPPFVALEWIEGAPLAADAPDMLEIGRDLAAALAAAHRLGLAHGRLTPTTIRRTAGGVKTDFTGLDVGARRPEDDAAALAVSCRAPEVIGNDLGDAGADVYALGAVMTWLFHGSSSPAGNAACPEAWRRLLPMMLAQEPADRPTALAVFDRLTERTGGTGYVATRVGGGPFEPSAVPISSARITDRIGRFRIVQKLGEGGMGAVYLAEDLSDGGVVALKMIQARWDGKEAAWRRFRKEARLLAEVNNPYVANFLEVNEFDGVPYLVMEYVDGKSLGTLLREKGKLSEAEAVAVTADVARALTGAHRKGIVHRDVKPDNILLCGEGGDGGPGRVKLCDFGLARHVVQSESLDVTHGGVVGTPFYASPEQTLGGTVDARSDVYALGATLFHALAGRPPFVADTHIHLGLLHANEPPPPLRSINPHVSDGICRIVEKALAKNPEARHADAEALLLDLERLRRGEPAAIAAHPRLPDADAKRVVAFDWTWEMESPAERLWPHVSNTERFNRAAGVPAVRFTSEAVPAGGVRRFGAFRKAGVLNAWREHPFEWVEGRRFGVLREYSQGVFKWFVSTTELKPRADGGTTLTHSVRLEPRNLLGRFVAAVEVGSKGRKAVERVYRRIDAFVAAKGGPAQVPDPFEPAAALPAAGRRRLDALLDRLAALGIGPAVVDKLGDFLRRGAPQEVARIRPLALAARLNVDPEAVTVACLHGAREGLLTLLWDIVCPICRIPSGVKETLRALAEHEHCPACAAEFKPDFSESVELIFRIHPQVRASELGVYCIGGPAHSPHVAAQVRVAAGETVELDLALAEGTYRVRGPQLPAAIEFHVRPGAAARRWDVRLGGVTTPAPSALDAGRQFLTLTNGHDSELVLRVERTAARRDALTAARASTLALFRELFPNEVLAPGQLVNVSSMTLLTVEVDEAAGLYEAFGDARAFGVLHGVLQRASALVRREGGAVVKTVGEGLMAAFLDPAAAVRVGLDLAAQEGSAPAAGLRLRVGAHRGPVLAAAIDDHLDYFGATVNRAARLPRLGRGGDLILTSALAADPAAAALLRARGLTAEVLADDGDLGLGPLHRLTSPPADRAASS
jgi:class 3 adenylate cyclase/tRNA A-37 threonylcarbamoyl transferase component Bud32